MQCVGGALRLNSFAKLSDGTRENDCSSKVINEIRRHMRWISVHVLTFIFKCPEAVRCSYVILPSWLQSSTKAFQAWDVVTNLLPMTPLGWTTLKTLLGVKVWATRLGTIASKHWQEASALWHSHYFHFRTPRQIFYLVTALMPPGKSAAQLLLMNA